MRDYCTVNFVGSTNIHLKVKYFLYFIESANKYQTQYDTIPKKFQSRQKRMQQWRLKLLEKLAPVFTLKSSRNL